MQESLLDDDDLLNESDGLGGEDEAAAAPSAGAGAAGEAERGDDDVPWAVEHEQREHKKRAKERAKELRDAKVVRMILQEQQTGGAGQPAPATKEELQKLDWKKLRERAIEAGCDKEELDKLFKEEDDISIVTGGIAVELRPGRTGWEVAAAGLAFGGMAATTVVAARTMVAMGGQPWTEAALKVGSTLVLILPLRPYS